MADGDLAGRRVLVTGGGRGIGAAIAGHLASAGAAVVLTYRRDEAATNAVCARISAAGGEASGVGLDLADTASTVDTVREAVRRLGGLDAVVSNAGAARSPMPGGAPYVTGKAGVEALAACLAREERRHGIRVNVVAPGLVDTEMGRRLVRATQGVDDIRELDAGSPFGRVCAPGDVAEVVGFLLGPGAAYVNDQRIAIDGGAF